MRVILLMIWITIAPLAGYGQSSSQMTKSDAKILEEAQAFEKDYIGTLPRSIG